METGASQQAIQDMATFNLLAKELYFTVKDVPFGGDCLLMPNCRGVEGLVYYSPVISTGPYTVSADIETPNGQGECTDLAQADIETTTSTTKHQQT